MTGYTAFTELSKFLRSRYTILYQHPYILYVILPPKTLLFSYRECEWQENYFENTTRVPTTFWVVPLRTFGEAIFFFIFSSRLNNFFECVDDGQFYSFHSKLISLVLFNSSFRESESIVFFLIFGSCDCFPFP